MRKRGGRATAVEQVSERKALVNVSSVVGLIQRAPDQMACGEGEVEVADPQGGIGASAGEGVEAVDSYVK